MFGLMVNDMMEKRKLEKKLADLFGKKHCLLVGSATAGLTFVFQALGLSANRKPLLPGISCLVAYGAARYAGTQPLVTDITLTDYTMCPESLETMLRTYPEVQAIVPTHLYGHLYDIEKIHGLARRYSIPVVEDAAQAMGAIHQHQYAGSLGDIGVVSFGHTKVLEAGHGGAIITNHTSLYERISKYAEQIVARSASELNKLQLTYRERYYQKIEDGSAWSHSSQANILSLQEEYRDCFVLSYDGTFTDRISNLVDKLSDEIAKRNQKAEIYNRILLHPLIQKPMVREGSACWRYTFRVPSIYRDSLLKYLRARKIDCSSWYPYYPRLFGAEELPNSLVVEKEIINVWVNEHYSLERIKNTCQAIIEGLETLKNE